MIERPICEPEPVPDKTPRTLTITEKLPANRPVQPPTDTPDSLLMTIAKALARMSSAS